MNKCRNVAKSLFFILLSMCSTTFAFEPIRTDVLLAKEHEKHCHGPRGHRGKKGEEGDRGPRGFRGRKGHEGEEGEWGHRGHRGKRGDRGHEGKKGKHGHRGNTGLAGGPTGPTGPQGVFGVTQYSSAATEFTFANNGVAGSIAPGNNILSFTLLSSSGITYSSVTGLFTSTAGPGFYEVIYGAKWTPATATLVLRVDGVEVNPASRLTTSADFATESIIIQSLAVTPTFALGNAAGPFTNMLLAGTGSNTSAFISIKKIQ